MQLLIRKLKRDSRDNVTKTYPVATADSVPIEMSFEGFLRSPLMLIPAMTPVRAGKKTPKTLNQLWCSVYAGRLLATHTVEFQPKKPRSEKLQKIIVVRKWVTEWESNRANGHEILMANGFLQGFLFDDSTTTSYG